MATTIIPKQGSFAGTLGTGIGQALQQLAHNKVAQMQKQEGLASLFEPQQAQALSSLDTELLKPIITEKAKSQRQLSTTGPGIKTIAPDLTPEQADKIGALPASVQNLWYKNYLESPQQAIEVLNGAPKKFSKPEIKEFAKSNLQELRKQNVEPSVIKDVVKEIEKPSVEPAKEARKKVSDYMNEGYTKTEAKELFKDVIKKENIDKKLAIEEKQEAFKQTKDLREGMLEKGKIAKQAIDDLDRMLELDKTGKLDTPGYTEFLKEAGFDIPALLNPESEEFGKIAANFQRGAKEIYGSRISNFEVEQFLKTIPSLSQSPEGRKRVIANLKKIYSGNLAYIESMKEIIKDNKGTPPLDLAERIDDKVGKKLDKIAEKFKEDLTKPVPKGQNKLITALQIGGGKVLGKTGKLAKAGLGAFSGYKIGSRLGPVGSAVGAGIGGLLGLTGLGGLLD